MCATKHFNCEFMPAFYGTYRDVDEGTDCPREVLRGGQNDNQWNSSGHPQPHTRQPWTEGVISSSYLHRIKLSRFRILNQIPQAIAVFRKHIADYVRVYHVCVFVQNAVIFSHHLRSNYFASSLENQKTEKSVRLSCVLAWDEGFYQERAPRICFWGNQSHHRSWG